MGLQFSMSALLPLFLYTGSVLDTSHWSGTVFFGSISVLSPTDLTLTTGKQKKMAAILILKHRKTELQNVPYSNVFSFQAPKPPNVVENFISLTGLKKCSREKFALNDILKETAQKATWPWCQTLKPFTPSM